MIPYFQLTTITLGPLTLNVWGLLAAIGFLVATIVAAARARVLKMDSQIVWSVSWQVVIASMVGSRLFEVLFYEPAYYWANPGKIFAVWEGGLSSYGGIIGGALALLWFIRRNKLPLWSTLDIFAYATPLGFVFGRIGCFLIHDHPGTLTSFIGGVKYPDGVRHDGGLEMAIADGFIFLIMVLVAHRSSLRRSPWRLWQSPPPGTFVLLFLGLKGLARFILDFFRATSGPIVEARYGGLSPSQYVGLCSVIITVWVVSRHWKPTRSV